MTTADPLPPLPHTDHELADFFRRELGLPVRSTPEDVYLAWQARKAKSEEREKIIREALVSANGNINKARQLFE